MYPLTSISLKTKQPHNYVNCTISQTIKDFLSGTIFIYPSPLKGQIWRITSP